ncbi:branched-chain amino acid ABC transporter permease [Haloglomus litoreum]|uniref:branched-chain amino acid ABC transporter permease n=1 Tax=Haloglomus litoreum TaxID=3034026 RepID=UPI0023E8479B|nr:branched-chain amino acid ABC transporter permease [Haloglomus sp. DT116]
MSQASVVFGVLANGIAIGMLFFLVASGLSLVFGLMGVVNFAHGSLYMIGAYVGLTVFDRSGLFLVALLTVPFLVAGIGVVMEYLTLRPLYDRDPIYQILLTFGIALMLDEGVRLVWGLNSLSFGRPAWLAEALSLGGVQFPSYRVFVIALGIVVSLGLYLFLERTRFGLVVRAGTNNRDMVELCGVNVKRAFTVVFGVGAAMAAVAGVAAGPMFSVYPAMGSEMIIEAFAVVVIGGLGSFRGSLVGALAVGLLQAFGNYYLVSFSSMLIFALMIVVLLVRPHGLLGDPEANHT